MAKQKRQRKYESVHGKTFRILLAIAVIAIVLPFVLDIFNGTYEKHDDTAAAENNFVAVRDDADLFTDEEEDYLRSVMSDFLPYGSAAVYTTYENPYGDTDALADHMYEELVGDYYMADGSLFVIDMDNRYLLLSNGGEVTKKVADRDCDEITDNVYRYASTGEYSLCASSVFEQEVRLLRDQAIPRTMKHISNLILSIGISVCAVFVFAQNKTKMKEYTPEALFENNAAKNVTLGPDDKCVMINRKKTRHVEVSGGSYSGGGGRSGGGGGYSGGGGGGGGHSGGGGGGGHSSGGHGF